MIKLSMGRLAAALMLLMSFSVHAQERRPAPVGDRWHAEVYGGWQQENLHWSIAGNSAGQNPNVYSELKWRHVAGITTGGALRWEFLHRWLVFAEGSRMSTHSGSVTDTDYGADNRTDPVYKEKFDARQGYDYAAAGGIGYRFWEGKRMTLTASAGFLWSGQSLSITDPGGVYASLDSKYATHWKGGLLRGEALFLAGTRWQLSATLTYRQMSYHADADWNLISSFQHPVSFRHHADGYGVDAEGRIAYRLCHGISVFLDGTYFNWQTGTGVDELYEASGGSVPTQLNGVVLTGYKGRMGVVIRK